MSDTEDRNLSGSLDSLADILNNLDSDVDEYEKTNVEVSARSHPRQEDNSEDPTKSVDHSSNSIKNTPNQSVSENVGLETLNLDVSKENLENLEKNLENPTNLLANSDSNKGLGLECSKIEKIKLEGVTEDETDDSLLVQKKLNRSQSIKSEYSEANVIKQFLDHCNDDAEARLLARRQARAEARDIRMRELERQQREQEENADRQYDMLEATTRAARTAGNRYLSSRRSSEDSLEDGGSLREIRHELKEMEEKFRKAMIANAQLDNDKASQTYQLELLKDRLEELEEEHSQLRREHRDKCREHDQLKRLAARLKDDLAVTRAELEEHDLLIAEKGLVIVIEDLIPYEDGIGGDTSNNGIVNTPKKSLVSAENAQLLENAGEGSLDVRLARFASEKKDLQDQISHLRLELEEEKSKKRKTSGVTLNGPTSDSDYDADDVQRDIVRQLADYKFRAQKAEQDVATLQATVARLESQVIRYKSAAEMYEKSEEALKQEKRKLQREAREAQNRAEELETSNTHLLKRLDKLKNAKSTLLKEL